MHSQISNQEDGSHFLHINQTRHDNSLSIINYLSCLGVPRPIFFWNNGYDIPFLDLNCSFTHLKRISIHWMVYRRKNLVRVKEPGTALKTVIILTAIWFHNKRLMTSNWRIINSDINEMQNQNTHRFQLAGLEMQNQVSK